MSDMKSYLTAAASEPDSPAADSGDEGECTAESVMALIDKLSDDERQKLDDMLAASDSSDEPNADDATE